MFMIFFDDWSKSIRQEVYMVQNWLKVQYQKKHDSEISCKDIANKLDDTSENVSTNCKVVRKNQSNADSESLNDAQKGQKVPKVLVNDILNESVKVSVYVCDICGLEFLQQDKLREHSIIHGGETYVRIPPTPLVFFWSA